MFTFLFSLFGQLLLGVVSAFESLGHLQPRFVHLATTNLSIVLGGQTPRAGAKTHGLGAPY